MTPKTAPTQRNESSEALILAALYDVWRAAASLDMAEDFSEMPCQHECCAPGDWDVYQQERQRLHDAIRRVDELTGNR